MWLEWHKWPVLSVSMDLGSDGLSGWHALAYGKKMSIMQFPDPSHAGNLDVDMALRSAGLFQFWLLNMISFNLPYGPDDDLGRLHQLQDATRDLFARHGSSSCELCQGLQTFILDDLQQAGIQLDEPKE